MYLTKYCFDYKLPSGQIALVNILSGKISKINESIVPVLKMLRDGKEDGLTGENIKVLKKAGVLFHSKLEELVLVTKLFNNAEKVIQQKPLLYGICITYACNLRCTYCYEDKIHNQESIMSKEKIDNAFNAIKEIQKQRNSKKSRIVLFGGEPFMVQNRDALEYYFKKAREFIENETKKGQDSKLTAFSNGVELVKFSDLLKEYKDEIDSIMLTLNGPKEIHDVFRKSPEKLSSFDQTIKTIELLLEIGIAVNVRMDVDKRNIDTLKDIAKYVIKKGWHKNPKFRYYISPIRWHCGTSQYEMEEYEILEKFIELDAESEGRVSKVFSLGALRVLHNIVNIFDGKEKNESPFLSFYHCESVRQQQYILGTDGYIYRCLVSIGQPEYAFGTYEPNVLMDNEKEKEWKRRCVLDMPKCKDCKAAFLCGGGCAFKAHNDNGSIWDRVCINAEKTLIAYLKAQDKGIEVKSYGFYYDN